MNEQMHGIRYRKGREKAALKWAHLGTWLFDWGLLFFRYIYLKYLLFWFCAGFLFLLRVQFTIRLKGSKRRGVKCLQNSCSFIVTNHTLSRQYLKKQKGTETSFLIHLLWHHPRQTCTFKEGILWWWYQNTNSLPTGSLLTKPFSIASFKNLTRYVILDMSP